MEKGHIELGEILFVALLVVGLATAILLIVDGKASPITVTPVTGNASQNTTPPPNQPTPPIDTVNETGNQPVPVAEPTPLVMNESTGTLVEEGLMRADSWFITTAPKGNFDRDTYGWAMGLANDSPDKIPIKTNDLRAVEVRIDGRYDDSLRAFAFRLYSSSDVSEPARLYAIAVFISNSTLIDSANSTFGIQYDPYPEGPQILEGCSTRNSSLSITPGGSPVKVYDITCNIMYGVYP